MSYVLQGGSFSRTFQASELATLSFKLLASQQSYFKVDGIAVILLSDKGYLFLIQVDGVGSIAGRTLFENYNFSYDSSHEFQVKLTSKTLSEHATLSQGLQNYAYSSLLPVTSLDALHALTYIVPPPGPSRYVALDNSEQSLSLLRRTSHSHAHRNQFNDFGQEDQLFCKLT